MWLKHNNYVECHVQTDNITNKKMKREKEERRDELYMKTLGLQNKRVQVMHDFSKDAEFSRIS